MRNNNNYKYKIALKKNYNKAENNNYKNRFLMLI